MPGERTLYRKMQAAIEYAKDGRSRSADDLEDYVYRRSPTNFVYYWRDRDTDQVRQDYSRGSIHSTVELCLDLGLISDQGKLTPAGVSATDARRFPSVVGNRVAKLLAKNGITLEAIRIAIEEALRSPTPEPPTGDAIWKRLHSEPGDIDAPLFKRLISLLGECKILSMSQRRIFLPLPNHHENLKR